MKLVLPKPRTEVKKRFSYAGEKIWNDLPENIRCNGNLDGFKRYLKSLLLQWQYCFVNICKYIHSAFF